MRIAVLTDLHANREALEAVLAHTREQGAEAYALLGDFVGYGADPGWVVDRVRTLVEGGAIAVRGNHDEATVLGPSPTMREEPRQVIAWTRAQLDDTQLEFLAALHYTQRTGDALYVHANAWAPRDWGYVFGLTEAAQSLLATDAAITFCGHVHEPGLYHLARSGRAGLLMPPVGEPVPLWPPRQWLALPGSVGQPRDGDPAAAYALHDTIAATLTFWRVPYDHETAAAKIIAAGLPRALGERLAHGV